MMTIMGDDGDEDAKRDGGDCDYGDGDGDEDGGDPRHNASSSFVSSACHHQSPSTSPLSLTITIVAIQVKSPNFWLTNCDGGSTRRLVDESGSGCPRKRFHAVPALGRGVLDAVC